MGYHYECLVLALAEGVYNVFYQGTSLSVKTVQGFVKDKKLRVFDEGSRE